MSKFYRVKKDTFMWEAGAILENNVNGGDGYTAINDIWHVAELGTEYISARIIEKNPEWFERVYPVNLLSKVVYKLKAEAKEAYSKEHSA